MTTQTEPRIAGTVVLQHRQVMEERYGKPLVTRASGSLDETERAELAGAMPGKWVTLTAFQKLYDAVSRETGVDLDELHTAVTRESTSRTVRTVWRMLLRLSSDDMLIARTPDMYKKAFSIGEVTSRLVAPGRSENFLTGWPEMPNFAVRQVRVATETVLTLAGRSDIAVQVERRPDGVIYRTFWR